MIHNSGYYLSVKILLALFFYSISSFAEVNLETHELALEYGLAYHTLRGDQKNNNSEGRITSDQMPYWIGSYAYRFSDNFALKFFGGIQTVKFNEPKYGTLKAEDQVFNQFGMELMTKTSVYAKWGLFIMQQDHPLYYAKETYVFQVLKRTFYQGGLHYSLGQRRRIGLIWGTGLKLYTIFPRSGGNISTESGAGAEGYARLGWVGPFGTTYQIKGFYLGTTAPNADVNFSHELLGYSAQITYSF